MCMMQKERSRSECSCHMILPMLCMCWHMVTLQTCGLHFGHRLVILVEWIFLAIAKVWPDKQNTKNKTWNIYTCRLITMTCHTEEMFNEGGNPSHQEIDGFQHVFEMLVLFECKMMSISCLIYGVSFVNYCSSFLFFWVWPARKRWPDLATLWP